MLKPIFKSIHAITAIVVTTVNEAKPIAIINIYNSGNMNMPAADKPATLMNGLGSYHHAVSTTNKEAQRFFDQGLTFVYAFNHEAAIRSFKRAAELDPQMAMAYWGIALALGPNINLDVDPEREKAYRIGRSNFRQ